MVEIAQEAHSGAGAKPIKWPSATDTRTITLFVVLGCGLIGAAIVLIVASLLARDRSETQRRAQVEAQTLATILADHADRVVENAALLISQAAAIVGAKPDVLTTDEPAQQKLRELSDRSPYVDGIWVGDAAGNSVLTSYVFPAPRLNASDRDYVRFVREHPGRLSITFVPRSLYSSSPQIKINRSIDQDHPYRGFVTIDVSQRQFNALYSRLKVGPAAPVWLVEARGRPVYREPSISPEQLTQVKWTPIEDDVEEGEFRALDPITSVETLYVFRRSPNYGLLSLVALPLEAVLAQWRTRFWVYIGLTTAALLGIVGLGFAAVNWLTREQARSVELEGRVQARTAELRDALEQKDVLVAELNHRVKNNLASIQSIARHTVRSSPDLPTFLRTFEKRLIALSSTYSLLTETNWGTADLRDLLSAELAPYVDEKGERVKITGPSVHLSPIVALSTGLVIHELATNAAKYGALSVSSGSLAVSWSVVTRGDTSYLHLNWAEHDGPRVSPPGRVGFGTRLITSSFERVGGVVRLEYPETGAQCTVEVPLLKSNERAA